MRASLSLFLLLWVVVTTAAAPALHFYPTVAYRDEACTFAFEGEPGQTVQVSLQGELIASDTFKKTVLELNLRLPGPGLLEVTIGDASFGFEVVTPEAPTPLTSHQNVLQAADHPAILLADHRLPPLLDRRWETVRVVKDAVDDKRPRVEAVTLLGGLWLPPATRLAMAAGRWRLMPPGESTYEVDAVITQLPSLKAPQAVAVSLSADDLRHGHRQELLRIKLEWLLQALAVRFPETPRFLFSLPLTEKEHGQWPDLETNLKVAAEANDTIFVNGYFQRLPELTAEAVNGAVLPHLRKVIVLP